MGYVGVWVAGVRGCLGYVGQNIFYVGQHFTWVIILRGLRGSIFFTWVAWVKLFIFILFYFIFAWVSFYLLDEVILPYYN